MAGVDGRFLCADSHSLVSRGRKFLAFDKKKSNYELVIFGVPYDSLLHLSLLRISVRVSRYNYDYQI